MNSKIYYKVVAKKSEKLVSVHGHYCFTPELDSVVIYKVGEFVSAPKFSGFPTKLFVFDDKSCALNFIKYTCIPDLLIFSCEIENPCEIDSIASFFSDIKDYWRNDRICVKGFAPTGTIACNKVKLIEETHAY